MISIDLTKKSFWENDVEGFVLFVSENFNSIVDLSEVEKTYPQLKLILKKHQFKGKVGQSFSLTAERNGILKQFVFIGTGRQNEVWYRELENLRRTVGAAVIRLKSLEVESAVIQIPDKQRFGVEEHELIKQMVVAASMASYEFSTFKSDKKKEWNCKILISSDGKDNPIRNNALSEAKIISEAINDARLVCDMPPNVATPTYVSEEAKRVSSLVGNLKCAVFGRDRAAELGMGGFLSVDVGSEQDGKFIVLEYECEQKGAPTIALIGKGVTFDSGGISLKPSTSMTGMKFDMSGSSAVIAAMRIIAQLKPNVNVVGIAPMVENMPSGRANKQDDIITFMNGKTAEIISTDAEGRLILADALCYAEKFYKPSVIIDIATLTGACLYALGHSYTALMTQDEKLSSLLVESGRVTGDRVWPLPMDEDFRDAIKSDVADIANSGSTKYKAGTITAGLFLSNFVENAKWAHLDIAGTADGVPNVNYLGSGATGVGIRLLTDFVMNRFGQNKF